MRKKLQCLSFILIIVLCFACVCPVLAHDREEHDEDIEYVLFGDRDYKDTHPSSASKIQAIEDAAYLCIDQFNGGGKDALKNLQKEKIPGIPKKIEEIDFKSNSAHRYYTHRGWNVTTNPDKAHWEKRQTILINTVDKELFADDKSFISKVPVLSQWFAAEELKENKKKCESLCVLIYYVHIIGDHNEAKKFSALTNVDPLTSLNDRDNPGIIPDLIKYCGMLFEDQKNTYTYENFMQELEELKDESDKLTSSRGGVNSETKFQKYHHCSDELLEVLGTYIPEMLRKEEFFQQDF